jgi:hypothetical protein
MKWRIVVAMTAMAVAAIGTAPGQAADVQYDPAEATYDYCLELARDEANANIGVMYLRPGVINGDAQAIADKQELKQRKKLAQKEQRKEKCI